MKVLTAIELWGICFRVAEDNPQLLHQGRGAEEATLIGDICAARMTALGAAERLMMLKCDEEDAPELLLRYKRACDNPACVECGLSSKGCKHPECQAKLDEYFNAREALGDFATWISENA